MSKINYIKKKDVKYWKKKIKINTHMLKQTFYYLLSTIDIYIIFTQLLG